MILPERMKKGDTIGVVAPASPPSMENLENAEKLFQTFGFYVQYGKHVKKVNGYLAGTDEERLEDFHDMIRNPKIKAIFFARGGYGTGRIASKIDYDLIKKYPKIILGYSDITYLHTAIRQKTDLVTFHGPMPAFDFGKGKFEPISIVWLWNALLQPEQLIYSDAISPLKVISPGEAEGQFIGGNLSLMISTLGTPYEIDMKDKILLMEDIREEPYRVDSMLNQLKLSGKLDQLKGVVIGDFANADSKLPSTFTLDEVFEQYFKDAKYPVMSGFQIGHCQPHFSVPLGVKATLSTSKKKLLIDAGVK